MGTSVGIMVGLDVGSIVGVVVGLDVGHTGVVPNFPMDELSVVRHDA